jgi:hypothetical protein
VEAKASRPINVRGLMNHAASLLSSALRPTMKAKQKLKASAKAAKNQDRSG